MTKYTLQESDNAFNKILGSKEDEKSSLGCNIQRNFVMQSGHILFVTAVTSGGYSRMDKRLKQGIHAEFRHGRLQQDDRGDKTYSYNIGFKVD
jgi:hypothetical protein